MSISQVTAPSQMPLRHRGQPVAARSTRRPRSRWASAAGSTRSAGATSSASSPCCGRCSRSPTSSRPSLNPLGNVVTTTMIPQTFSLENFDKLLNTTRSVHERWDAQQPDRVRVRGRSSSCFFSALAAYAFSRFRFTGRRGGLLALLLIQMFPQYLAAGRALPDVHRDRRGRSRPSASTPWLGYIIVLCGSSLGQVWLIKGFFDSIPMSLDEAAMIDGASHVQVFFRIILPLIRPILAVCGLLVFVGVDRRVPAGLDLPARREQEDAGHRALRAHRRGPLQQPRGLRGGRDHDRDPGGAAVPVPPAVHRRRHDRRRRQGMTSHAAPARPAPRRLRPLHRSPRRPALGRQRRPAGPGAAPRRRRPRRPGRSCSAGCATASRPCAGPPARARTRPGRGGRCRSTWSTRSRRTASWSPPARRTTAGSTPPASTTATSPTPGTSGSAPSTGCPTGSATRWATRSSPTASRAPRPARRGPRLGAARRLGRPGRAQGSRRPLPVVRRHPRRRRRPPRPPRRPSARPCST